MRRLFSLFVSGILLLIFAPILLGTACLIYLEDGRPVLFRQTRAGLYNRPFMLVKFRSMRVNNISTLHDRSQASEIREDHPLVTKVGRWIRRYKVDELPQLFNVFVGDMALIGPRPTVPEQTARYSSFEMRRLNVLPGMTGWAQINGGIELTWSERILLDIWYVDHRSVGLDLLILGQTLGVVLLGENPNRRSLEQAIDYANCRYGEAVVSLMTTVDSSSATL